MQLEPPRFIWVISSSNVQSVIARIKLWVQVTNLNPPEHLHLEDIRNFEIPLPPLEIQRQIVEKLDLQMQALEGVRLLKEEAEKRIEEILTEVWEGKL